MDLFFLEPRSKFTVKAEGNLTISGVKKSVLLEFSLSIVGSKITLIGEKKIKMADFKIDPPTALLGTITTGDDITIKFVLLQVNALQGLWPQVNTLIYFKRLKCPTFIKKNLCVG